MYPAAKGFLRLRVDISLPDQTAERGLDMGARAAEAVIKVQVAEGRVEIVAPEQVDHAAAEPDALRVAGRPGQKARCLGDLVDLFLGFLGCVGGWFLRFGRLAVSALREGGRDDEKQARHTTEHDKKLTQLERNPHCPRRMFVLGPVLSSLGPVCDRIGTLIRRWLTL